MPAVVLRQRWPLPAKPPPAWDPEHSSGNKHSFNMSACKWALSRAFQHSRMTKKQSLHFKARWVISLQRLILRKLPFSRTDDHMSEILQTSCVDVKQPVCQKKQSIEERRTKVCVAHVHHRKKRALPTRLAYLWLQRSSCTCQNCNGQHGAERQGGNAEQVKCQNMPNDLLFKWRTLHWAADQKYVHFKSHLNLKSKNKQVKAGLYAAKRYIPEKILQEKQRPLSNAFVRRQLRDGAKKESEDEFY